jgi:hypothetical protein
VPEEGRKPARVYTNDDLDQVRPFRDQTGVESKPDSTTDTRHAGTPRQGRRAGAPAGAADRNVEEQWRRSAERLREKLLPLREKVDDLRVQIEERRREPGVRPYTDAKVVALQRRIEVLERRIREAESRFEDRARRQGAMPGWIR